jgi:hypothetical protein
VIKVFVLLLVRALLEAAIIFLAVGALLLVFSYRLGRRLATTSPDPLERMSGRAAQLVTLFPRRADGDASPPTEGTES